MITLAELPRGQKARIRTIATTTNLAYRRKLLALGLLPGTEVEMQRVAPLGDPMEIRLRGYHLSLRRDEALALEIDLLDNTV
jgi:Fe2+ transport system protein FeoA